MSIKTQVTCEVCHQNFPVWATSEKNIIAKGCSQNCRMQIYKKEYTPY